MSSKLTSICQNPLCGKELRKRYNKYCSNLCQGEHLSYIAEQKYNENPIKCQHCGVTIPYSDSKTKTKFCSPSCSASCTNKGKIKSEESKAKISQKLKGRIIPEEIREKIRQKSKERKYTRKKSKERTCTSQKSIITDCIYPHTKVVQTICQHCGKIMYSKTEKIKKFCSDECRNQASSIRMTNYLKHNRSHIKGRGEPSWMEQTFAKWLEDNGIKKGFNGFLTEVKIYNPETKKYGFLDFTFPHKKLIIELDGNHHRNRVELDKIRDEYLNSRGWTVLRITHKEYRNKTKIDIIKQLLELS